MEIELLLKIAAIGIIVALLNTVLSRSGREEYAMLTVLAGILLIVLINMWSGGSRVWQTISLVILTLTQFGTMWLNHKSMKMINEGSK